MKYTYNYFNDSGDYILCEISDWNYYYNTTWSYNQYYLNDTYYYHYVYKYTYNYTTEMWYYDNDYVWDSYFKLYTEDYKYNMLWYYEYTYMREGSGWWTYNSFYEIQSYALGNVSGQDGSSLNSEFTSSYGSFDLREYGPSIDEGTIVSFMSKFD